jgi:hypothetical protein
MTWNEEQHPRNRHGEFTHASVGAWVKKAIEDFKRLDGGRVQGDYNPTRELGWDGDRPAGHAAAKARAQELWSVPSTREPTHRHPLTGRMYAERTDEEQDELDALERAFKTYREESGLIAHRDPNAVPGEHYQDEYGNVYNKYGEHLADKDEYSFQAPIARRRGYTRVGDHPEGAGKVGGATHSHMGTPSLHPQAGGVWQDPDDPGPKYAPRYVNDAGHSMRVRAPSHSHQRRLDAAEQRRGANRTMPEDAEPTFVRRAPGRNRLTTFGTFGYEARYAQDENGDGGAAAFVLGMKRAQARARAEQPKAKKRRTPRGTQVDSWMQAASAQIAQKRGN